MYSNKKCSEQINSSEPLITAPLKLIRQLKSDLSASRELSWRLFHRNISAQYRHSFLGFVWAFVPALATAGIWTVLKSNAVINISDPTIPYPIFVLIGTLSWKSFSEAINTPLNSFLSARSMLTKIDFPKEALLISGLGHVIFNSLIRLIIIFAVLLFTNITFSAGILLFPLSLFFLIVLGASIGTFLVPLGMLYHDVSRFTNYAVQLWFYLTPIVYPKPFEGFIGRVASLNPVTPLLSAGRNWLTGETQPITCQFMLISASGFILLLLGWLIIKLTLPHLIERVSN